MRCCRRLPNRRRRLVCRYLRKAIRHGRAEANNYDRLASLIPGSYGQRFFEQLRHRSLLQLYELLSIERDSCRRCRRHRRRTRRSRRRRKQRTRMICRCRCHHHWNRCCVPCHAPGRTTSMNCICRSYTTPHWENYFH